MAKLETARKPRPSPIVIMCGSFDAFADATYAEVMAGTLAGDFLLILDHLREWDEQGVWALAYAR
ncbi:hypothetical protein [Sphingomonas sp. MM-1]|uniref:hypothetical protein n=1 Tax=Sphingomonas sp. MM-1 TaxID=745310 RepID=UPI00118257B2|nr:hypothetical protein [Sphingomonas sp. MM-1]